LYGPKQPVATEFAATVAGRWWDGPDDETSEADMARVLAGMTISLDGFITDRNDDVGRLYPDFQAYTQSDFMKESQESTGAVLMGARTFEMGDPNAYVGEYEFQVPIFVVTHRPPAVAPKQDDRLTFTFVTDGVLSAVARACEAAGDRDVLVVGGADLIGQLLADGLVDELHVDIMPVLLGVGRRLFDSASLDRVTLEKIDVRELGQRTMLRLRVVR
jgi:dihydrofolate reductase